jgi:hypothetical protein
MTYDSVMWFLLALVISFWVTCNIHDLQSAKKWLLEENRNLNVMWERLNNRVRALGELLGPGVGIDVGLRDRGWLILCCRVNGKDYVQLQQLKREMTMGEYKELVERLSYDFQHVAYIDAPSGMDSFLKEVSKPWTNKR